MYEEEAHRFLNVFLTANKPLCHSAPSRHVEVHLGGGRERGGPGVPAPGGAWRVLRRRRLSASQCLHAQQQQVLTSSNLFM